MAHSEKKPEKKQRGCGCSSIPISLIVLFLGGGYWLFSQREYIGGLLPTHIRKEIPFLSSPETEEPDFSSASPPIASTDVPNAGEFAEEFENPSTPDAIAPNARSDPQSNSQPNSQSNSQPDRQPEPVRETASKATIIPQDPWKQKAIRGIYLSRYQATNNADEQTIRDRIRYFRDRGINTIIHGVWGNGCTMYESEVMAKKLGYNSCPNEFQEPWLDWAIDEAHKQGMEVHAYFEKGIKVDEDSPLFDLAVERGWIVAGIDRTHPGVDHYVLNVGIPEVADFLTDILAEFVRKYPTIDAVQWDDYLGYHAELPGNVDRTAQLTNFVQKMIRAMKKANPAVNFDLCHHNPYWAKKYFAADWENWDVDRVFIQVYSSENFQEELKYVEARDGIAITEQQFDLLEELAGNDRVENILLFPLSGKPKEMAATFKERTQKIERR